MLSSGLLTPPVWSEETAPAQATQTARPAPSTEKTQPAIIDVKHCARLVNVQRGIQCGESSLLVVVQNVCDQNIQISTCIQLPDETWDCGLDHGVNPEKKVGRWACESTGEYRFVACSLDVSEECSAKP